MVDIYNKEETELKTMIADGEQNNEEYSAQITTVFYDEVQHERPIVSKFSKSFFSIPAKRSTLYSVGLLVFIIGISAVAFVSHHGRNEIVNKQGYADDQYYYKSGSKEDLGYFNIYIRIPGNEPYTDKLRFPAARYSRHQLPLSGRVIDYQLPTPIRVHVSTRQTIIYMSGKVFLLPPLFNYYDDIFSIGELIASGYAWFVNNGDCLSDYVDVTSLFYPQRLTGPNVPKLNSEGDGFKGGVDTSYRSSFPSKLRQRPLYEFINSKQSDDYDYGKSYRPRNPYYNRPFSKTAKTLSTTTVTTTTAPNVACGFTCVDTAVSESSRLAFYSFDNVNTDAEGNYPLYGTASSIYQSGRVGSAISFNASNQQLLSTTSYIPLHARSFTIDFWLYVTDLDYARQYSIAGEQTASLDYQCFFLDIRQGNLYLGFFYADTRGDTRIVANKWYHVAFVYDNIVNEQRIYLDGVLDGRKMYEYLQTTTGNFTIGGAKIGGVYDPAIVYYSGYIDHFTISSRVKSACEIYLDAVLACYFKFDSISPIKDSGPNFLSATNNGATLTVGRVYQALLFSSARSYVTIGGINALISTNTAFSISMWVNPSKVRGGGTLIHASTQANGQESCLVLWGLTPTGQMSVNVISASNNTRSATSSSILPLNTWIHIAQTYSTTNGNRLYINGTLVDTKNAPTRQSIGPYVILGASPAGTSNCQAGSITPGQFYGSIDEFRVFGKELSSKDICRLASP